MEDKVLSKSAASWLLIGYIAAHHEDSKRQTAKDKTRTRKPYWFPQKRPLCSAKERQREPPGKLTAAESQSCREVYMVSQGPPCVKVRT